jgi:hypothetical protein
MAFLQRVAELPSWETCIGAIAVEVRPLAHELKELIGND